MSFRNWLLTETIVIQDRGEQAALFPTNGPFYDFNYQADNTWSTYTIGTWQSLRPGYINLGNRPTHVGIVKHSPLEAGKGIDFGFIKNLIQLLQKNGLRPIPYKEIGTRFDDLFKKINYTPEFSPETGWQTGETLPDMELGADVTHKISPGISTSKETGSWAYFITAHDSPEFYINKILTCLEQAAIPLVQNNLIDFYELTDRRTGQQLKITYSTKGKQEADEWKTNQIRAAAQLKYLANTLLNNAPTFKNYLLKHITLEHLKGGGKGWFGYDAPIQNFNLPLQKLYELNRQSFSDDIIIKIFLDAIQSNDPTKFQQLETLAKWAAKKDQQYTGQKYPPYWIAAAAEKLSWFWQKEEMLQECINRPLFYLSAIWDVIELTEILEILEPEEFNYWKKQVKDAIEEALPNAQRLSPNDISLLSKLAEPLELPPSLVHQIKHAEQQYKNAKEEREKQEKETALKRSYLMPENSYAYMLIHEGIWKTVPNKFIEYISGGNYQVNVGQLALHLLGDDVGLEDAISQAEQEAYEQVEERPSQSYGQNRQEVENDIAYEWEDFINDNPHDDLEELTDEQDIIHAIKNNYWNEFVNWKRNKMEEDEENDGRYTPDTESHDFQQRVYELQEQIAEQIAWNEGLVLLTTENNLVSIQMHKKYWTSFKPILKRTIEINMRTKDEESDEPYWKNYTKISMEFVDEPGFTQDAYSLLQQLGQSA